VRIEGAGESLHAKWVEVTDADITSSGRPLVKHRRRMMRFNAEQLWHNLIQQGWKRLAPQCPADGWETLQMMLNPVEERPPKDS
jgi:hypothetical protein